MDSQTNHSASTPADVLLIDGLRTPQINAATLQSSGFGLLDLAVQCSAPLLLRCAVTPHLLDSLILAAEAESQVQDLRKRLRLDTDTALYQCDHGLSAVALASQQIRSGDADLVLVLSSDLKATPQNDLLTSTQRLARLFDVQDEDASAFAEASRLRADDAEQGGLTNRHRTTLFDSQGHACTEDQPDAVAGACALLLASPRGLQRLKRTPLAHLGASSHAQAPAEYPTLAPLLAATRLLGQQQLSLADIDLWELPESPALALLSHLAAWQDADFCHRQLGLEQPVGRLDPCSLNVHGGSIALGALSATDGCRQLLQLADNLQRNHLPRGIVCEQHAGGHALALLITRPQETSE
ncbi:hypothetical protein [Halopseudomonas oceani]|uniref:hypothetical protein n=1 Tax=Halopseudomonas oceani TaxID=1708783 RepID=UPI002AA6DA36|nr:hypothetical protein [Halopseudomonas oceani]